LLHQVGIADYFMRKMHGQTTLKNAEYLHLTVGGACNKHSALKGSSPPCCFVQLWILKAFGPPILSSHKQNVDKAQRQHWSLVPGCAPTGF